MFAIYRHAGRPINVTIEPGSESIVARGEFVVIRSVEFYGHNVSGYMVVPVAEVTLPRPIGRACRRLA